SQAEIDPITYRWRGDNPRSCRLLGHLLGPYQLALLKPKICADCVIENRFIEAHYDLAFMTGCPVHKKRLLVSCPKCGKRLCWFRRGLLECRCGADLSTADRGPLSAAELDLLEIFRRKTLGMPSASEYASGPPHSHLNVMDLSSLLSLVFIIGTR